LLFFGVVFCVEFPPSFGVYRLPESGSSIFIVDSSGQMKLIPIVNILLCSESPLNLNAGNLNVYNSINSDSPTNIGQSDNPITLYSGNQPVNISADKTIIQNNVHIGGDIELDRSVKLKNEKFEESKFKNYNELDEVGKELNENDNKKLDSEIRSSGTATLFRVDGATGNTTILGTLTVSGNSSFGGTLGVDGALSAGVTTLASSIITGNETVGGTLSVTGATTLASSIITGNETVGGTLAVSGDTYLSNLNVSGSLTTSGTFNPSNVNLSGKLSVSGSSFLNATSISGGAVSINNEDLDSGVIVIGGKGGKNSSPIIIQSNNSDIVLDANSNAKNAKGNIVFANLQTTNNEAGSYFLVCDSSGNVKRGSFFINVNSGIEISSKRYKEEIRDLKIISKDAFRKLKVVLFKYKKEIDEKQREQLGLIAEDVSKIDELSDLIVIKKNGIPESVDYRAVMMILLQQYFDSCE
jgi:hypothetical protein